MVGEHGIGALTGFILGWFLAQLIKLLLAAHQNGLQAALALSTRPGGMPSGHTAGFVALTTFLGLIEGFNSSGFAIAAAVTIVVAYDAMNVRYAVGELGMTMSRVVKKMELKNAESRVVKGHKLIEVLVGAVLGGAIGWIMYLAQ
jgi:acid phosphatase family membrane protein YuiD